MTVHRPHLQRARKRRGASDAFDASVTPVDLPYREVDADDDTFVCEMTSGSNANETGAGGGLSGADLVFTRSTNTVEAASGGFRRIHTSGGFKATTNWFNALFRGPEWTIMFRVKDFEFSTAGATYFHYCNNWCRHIYFYGADNSPDPGYIVGYGVRNERLDGQDDHWGSALTTSSANWRNKSGGQELPSFYNGWCVVTCKESVLASFYAHGATPPKSIADATHGLSVAPALRSFDLPPVYDGTETYFEKTVVGICHGTRHGYWKHGTTVASKKALGIPKGLLSLKSLEY